MRYDFRAYAVDLTLTQDILNVTCKDDIGADLRYVSLTCMPAEDDSTEVELDGQGCALSDFVGEIRLEGSTLRIRFNVPWETHQGTLDEIVVHLPCNAPPWLHQALQQVCGPRVRYSG